LIASCLLVASFASPVWSQSSPDPQSLVGDWWGSWRARAQKGRGDYALTIERVEGEQVYGRAKTTGPWKADFEFTGRIEGKKLKFGREDAATELVIDGNRMFGAFRGTITRDIELVKSK
jgi:hypothetical protein